MPTYSIRNWDTHFENHESRKIKRLAWVPIPNKHDGKGYRRIMRLKDGPLIYAAWILIVQVASKCPKRGTLADSDGALDADDLADKTGAPPKYFDLAFKALVTKKIAWMACDALAGESPACPGECPGTPGESPAMPGLKGREGNRTEEKKTTRARAAPGDWMKMIPLEMNTTEFRESWCEWLDHRLQIKKKMTEKSAQKQLKFLTGLGIIRAIAAINHSIMQGWTGIYEEKGNGAFRQNSGDDPTRVRTGKDYDQLLQRKPAAGGSGEAMPPNWLGLGTSAEKESG